MGVRREAVRLTSLWSRSPRLLALAFLCASATNGGAHGDCRPENRIVGHTCKSGSFAAVADVLLLCGMPVKFTGFGLLMHRASAQCYLSSRRYHIIASVRKSVYFCVFKTRKTRTWERRVSLCISVYFLGCFWAAFFSRMKPDSQRLSSES